MTRLVYTTKQALGESAILNTSHPLARGMCLCLPFLEGGGSRSKDYSGNGWDMGFVGPDIGWGTGPYRDGPAVVASVSATTSYMASINAVNPTSAGVNPIAVGGNFTVATRQNIQVVGPGGAAALGGFGTSSVAGAWSLRYNNGTPFYRLGSFNGSTGGSPVAPPNTGLNQWVDYIVSCRALTLGFVFNAWYMGTSNATANVISSLSDKFTIFNEYNNLLDNEQAACSYFYVWNRALNPQEMQAVHIAPFSMFAQPRRRRAYSIPAAATAPINWVYAT